jgi:UDP-3-O-[3-hydroxymyristoyl] N-acetylglucosamine deacetylase/3-hydroxyacyl-[acyl-carrier-protein] dehydratase
MEKQRTIAQEIIFTGEGLHTGHPVTMILKPAPADTGIVFIRVDLAQRPAIKVSADALMTAPHSRRTSLGSGNVEVQTVEHLLAVLSGLGVDNLFIEIDSDELPGMDGSSVRFLDEIQRAGTHEQDKDRHYFWVKETLYVDEENGSSIIVLPCKDFKISYTLQYDHPFLKTQFFELTVTPESFQKELAMARTFCLEEDVSLQREGFGRGANHSNTLVVGREGVIKNKLRFHDEFVRHKILDLLGDLAIVGQPLKCHIVAVKSGHSLNLRVAKKLHQLRQKGIMAGIGTQYQVPDFEELDSVEIMKILPHREPFLFVDKIIAMEKGKRAVGVKNVTINDYFFRGHFPGKPVMPGVVIVEAMAQVAGVMMLSLDENRGKLAYFMAIDNARFRRIVVPGDQVILEIEAGKIKAKTGQVHGRALVDGKVVAEADLMFALA